MRVPLLFVLFAVCVVLTNATLVSHVIAHTHDDVGWLKTVDQYYYGANNTIQDARVQYVLDTVMQCLLDNPERRFIYVEIAYFFRWWREQTDEKKAVFRELVANGQFEFISAGWCMNDEASVHTEATIDQMTEGHQLILNEFGALPRIGWQIDPFGHAAGYANLIAQMGFDGLFYARQDYQDYANRAATKQLEYVWRPTRTFGTQTQIFTHGFYQTNYCFASGTAYEWGDQPVMDDPLLEDYNIDQLAANFVADMNNRAAVFATNQLLVPWGCDFAFSDAYINYKNMDKLIAYINNRTEQYGVWVQYSTPSIYLAAVHALNHTWSVKTDDNFPYADNPHSYWSGYFTSRQALKGYERLTSAELHAAQKLYSTAAGVLSTRVMNQSTAVYLLDQLAQSHGIAQHHDAVSGTSKQHVADDYALRLDLGELAIRDVVAAVVADLITPQSSPLPAFQFCPLLNESVCPPTQQLAANQFLPVVLYNSLSFARSQPVKLVVPRALHASVFDSTGTLVASQLADNADDASLSDLTFYGTAPALGFDTYLVATTAASAASRAKRSRTNLLQSWPVAHNKLRASGADVTLEGAFISATVSGSTNRLASVTDKLSGVTLALDQAFLWYNASNAGDSQSGQTDGAYIFRPNSSTPLHVTPNDQPLSVSVVQGPLVQEVRQVWASWLTQTIRVYNSSTAVELEITVQPMPIADGLGKELFAHFTTSLQTNSQWYTDSMGQEMQLRTWNYRPTWNLTVTEPVACNYFPMNTAAYQQDSSVRMTVLTDRSRGMGSMANGELELMIQRRLLHDDYRGVGEPLNETVPIRTRLELQVGSLNSTANQRFGAQRLNNPFLVLFGPASSSNSWFKTYQSTYSPLSTDLPPNVQLITLRTMPDGQVLLRLAHQFPASEDPTWSVPVTVDLSTLFVDYNITQIVETQLTAIQPLSDVHRLQWNTNSIDVSAPRQSVAFDPHPIRSVQDSLTISLTPMQIRTFLVQLTPK